MHKKHYIPECMITSWFYKIVVFNWTAEEVALLKKASSVL